MEHRFTQIMAGIVLPLMGLFVILVPVNHGERFNYDLSGSMKWFVGATFIILGLSILRMALKNKNKIRNNICPKCQTVSPVDTVDAALCIKCNILLEDLDGFYKRHRDLRKGA